MAGVKRGREKGYSPWGARKEGSGAGRGEAGTEYLFFPPSQAPATPPSSSSQAKVFVNQDLDNSCRSSEFTV